MPDRKRPPAPSKYHPTVAARRHNRVLNWAITISLVAGSVVILTIVVSIVRRAMVH